MLINWLVLVSTVALQWKGRGFDPAGVWGLHRCSLRVLPLSAWVLSGYLGFLPQCSDIQVGSVSDSKVACRRING